MAQLVIILGPISRYPWDLRLTSVMRTLSAWLRGILAAELYQPSPLVDHPQSLAKQNMMTLQGLDRIICLLDLVKWGWCRFNFLCTSQKSWIMLNGKSWPETLCCSLMVWEAQNGLGDHKATAKGSEAETFMKGVGSHVKICGQK